MYVLESYYSAAFADDIFVVRFNIFVIMNLIKRVKIEGAEHPFFRPCWELYLSAFVENERRGLDYQMEAMSKTNYNFEAILDDEELIGVIGWWSLAMCDFVEHLATFPSVRNRGYGAILIQEYINATEKPILLEVEPPVGEIERRRIGFYERLGFCFNEHNYAQPSYSGGDELELMVMSYPSLITEQELDEFKRESFPIVHFRYF